MEFISYEPTAYVPAETISIIFGEIECQENLDSGKSSVKVTC